METVRQFAKRHRAGLLGLCVALVCAMVLGWAGYDLASRVDGEPVYAIVNDLYSQTITLPRAGQGTDTAPLDAMTQTLTLQPGQTLYGVRLDFTTYNYAFQSGQVFAELQSAAGAPLARGAVDCVGLKDNTFQQIIFDQSYTAPVDGAVCQLRLWYTAPADDAVQMLGLWASEGVQTDASGAPLPLTTENTAGTTAANATAALQYVVDYSGAWSQRLSLILGVLIFAAIVLAYVLLWLCRAKLAVVVLVCGLLLGVGFSVLTPPMVGPDEYTHMTYAYQMASGILSQPVADADGKLLLRSCDVPYFQDSTGDIGIFAYKNYLSGLATRNCAGSTDTTGAVWARTDHVNPSLYLGQTLGVALARALGLGFYAMLLCGRLGNLLVYLALAVLAVCCAPQRHKPIFACVALLPMTLQLAASFSADGTTLGLVFAYTALCLALRARKAPNWGHCAALLLLAMAVAPAKAIYLPVVALVLLIPAAHLDVRPADAPPTITLGRVAVRPGTLVKALALALAALVWGYFNLGAVLYATRDVDNVGLTRAAVAVATAAVAAGLLYYKLHRNPLARKVFKGAAVAAVVVGVPLGIYRLSNMWGGLTPEQLVDSIQPNGDSIYTYSAGYICRNLPSTAKLLLRSVSEQGALWLQGLLGTALGEPIVYPVYVSWLLGVGLVAALLAVALPLLGEPNPTPPLNRRSKCGVAAVLLCVVGLTVFAALSWTPINYSTIFGVQGRYWLPVLPLALLLVAQNKTFVRQRDTSRTAVFAVLCLTSFVMLQGAGLYAAWQMQ